MIVVNKVNKTLLNTKRSWQQFLTKYLCDHCEQSEQKLSNIESSWEQFLTEYSFDHCEQSELNPLKN